MWLSTPRFLAGLTVLTVAILAVAIAQGGGAVDDGVARWIYAGAAVLVMAAIVWRARARWRNWTSR